MLALLAARFARRPKREKQSADDNDDNTEINIMGGSSANLDDRGKMGNEDEEDKTGEAKKVSHIE